MNYGPFYGMPYSGLSTPVRAGLFSRLLGGFNLGSILEGTQKTLNVVNQIIPIVKQVQPIMNNTKTMFKLMNELKKDETEPSVNNINTNNVVTNEQPSTETINQNENAPTFFM